MRREEEEGEIRVEAQWVDEATYKERAWDRFENQWVEKKGYFDGTKLVYL